MQTHELRRNLGGPFVCEWFELALGGPTMHENYPIHTLSIVCIPNRAHLLLRRSGPAPIVAMPRPPAPHPSPFSWVCIHPNGLDLGLHMIGLRSLDGADFSYIRGPQLAIFKPPQVSTQSGLAYGPHIEVHKHWIRIIYDLSCIG